ncbi:MAG: PRC-barrel domain-containing protein [Clostridia bacterium]|nr:PRC-barrel domain-containing protein [Clostridia bacterium]
MRKGREFMDKPVIDMNSGKLLGFVKGFRPGENQKIAGIYINTPQNEPAYVPYSMVNNLGRDAVLVQGSFIQTAESAPKPAGPVVMTAAGDNLGMIEDILLEELDGSITGYEISNGLLLDVVMGRKVVPAPNILAYHDDTVIIGDIPTK